MTHRRVACMFYVVLVFLGHAFVIAQSVQFQPVSPEIVEGRLRKYSGSDSRREVILKQLFAEAGCDSHDLTEQAVKGSKLPNAICKLPGDTDRIILIGAHFDHVPRGDGVVDNWSGASLLPSLYEATKGKQRKHTFFFIGSTDEELGEVGSHFYAQNMSSEEVLNTDAMVNMDTLGLAPTEVWSSHSDKQLQRALVYVAKQLNMTVANVNFDRFGSTDSEQFAKRKIPSITIHSLTQKAWDARILHTVRDQITELHLDEHYQTYRLLAAYLAVLDEVLPHQEVK